MARRKPGEGQTALVTGASMGIGVDLVKYLPRERLLGIVRNIQSPPEASV